MSNNVLEDLYQVVLDRKAQYASSGESADEIKKKSYTCYLFSQGENKILKKCGEEFTVMVSAAKNHDNNELKNEISDLLYHIMVLCSDENLPFSEVEAVLEERSKKIGNLKVLKQVDHET